ncbi:hypothetical protein V6N12_051329 [Hibiscus sabdariffa]|uniref:Uncharacterized protein n=1 Tax=Hibiscus sabdariffa TaxID=183260 RepID=A0ABR2GF24_9ROSI
MDAVTNDNHIQGVVEMEYMVNFRDHFDSQMWNLNENIVAMRGNMSSMREEIRSELSNMRQEFIVPNQKSWVFPYFML